MSAYCGAPGCAYTAGLPGMPAGTSVKPGNAEPDDCPSFTGLPSSGPSERDVVPMSIAHVAYSAPWKPPLTSWTLVSPGTWPPKPLATTTSMRLFGSQFSVVQPVPFALTSAHSEEFFTRNVPERYSVA